jgi:hypothetical protein
VLDSTPFGGDPCAAGLQLQILDVQREDLAGASCGLAFATVSCPQGDIEAPQFGDLLAGERPGGVDGDLGPGPTCRGSVTIHRALPTTRCTPSAR